MLLEVSKNKSGYTALTEKENGSDNCAVRYCNKCGVQKELSQFRKRFKDAKAFWRSHCKPCEKEYRQIRAQQTKEKRAEINKSWREKNKDKIALYVKNRRKLNANFKMAYLLRIRLCLACKSKSKTGSAVRDLGMPIDAFLAYLNLDALDKYGIPYTGNESLFHIDHIRPLAGFDLEDPEQLRIAVRWDNLQVLTIKENLSKGAKE